uniref:Uncharacterized protein n=1 Tax=Arundo donax TaxID=35708 RepID=A0A0A8YCU7_ARUDO
MSSDAEKTSCRDPPISICGHIFHHGQWKQQQNFHLDTSTHCSFHR